MSSSFLSPVFPSRFFKKARRSKTLTVDVPPSSSSQLPLQPPPALQALDKSQSPSLSSFSLRLRTPRTATAESFLPFEDRSARKVPSFDQLPPQQTPATPRLQRISTQHNSGKVEYADQALTRYHSCPAENAVARGNLTARTSHDRCDECSRAQRKSLQQQPQRPQYPASPRSRDPTDLDEPLHWGAKHSSGLEVENGYESDPDQPLDPIEVLQGFFDEKQSWQEGSMMETSTATPSESDSASQTTVTNHRPCFTTSFASASSSASASASRTSLSASITARLRRNSSRHCRIKLPTETTPSPRSDSLPLHQRPLPAPPSNLILRRQSTSSETLQPALESPIHPSVPYEARPPSLLTPDRKSDIERRLSLPSSMKTCTITTHIMPPEELTRIGSNKRRGSVSSLSSTGSQSQSHSTELQLCTDELITPLPRSPFLASFPSGLHPPPRPRGSLQARGEAWAVRGDSPKYASFFDDIPEVCR